MIGQEILFIVVSKDVNDQSGNIVIYIVVSTKCL